jgi:hypothetical protein
MSSNVRWRRPQAAAAGRGSFQATPIGCLCRLCPDILRRASVFHGRLFRYADLPHRGKARQCRTESGSICRRYPGRSRALAEKSRIPHHGLKAISISSKGLVADDNKTLLWSSVLGSQQIDMRKTLEPDWQATVTLSHESLLVASALHTSLSRKEGNRSHAWPPCRSATRSVWEWCMPTATNLRGPGPRASGT